MTRNQYNPESYRQHQIGSQRELRLSSSCVSLQLPCGYTPCRPRLSHHISSWRRAILSCHNDTLKDKWKIKLVSAPIVCPFWIFLLVQWKEYVPSTWRSMSAVASPRFPGTKLHRSSSLQGFVDQHQPFVCHLAGHLRCNDLSFSLGEPGQSLSEMMRWDRCSPNLTWRQVSEIQL